MVFRAVTEPNLCWGALRPRRRLLALRHVLPWKFRQICSIINLNLGNICYGFLFAATTGDVQGFSGAGELSIEAEVRHMGRRKHAVITRRFVPLPGQEPGPVEFGSHDWSRKLLEQAFDDGKDEFK